MKGSCGQGKPDKVKMKDLEVMEKKNKDKEKKY